MYEAINTNITNINRLGETFCTHAGQMLIQSSVLIVFLLIFDFLLRKKVRAVFRYCVWMLIFIKLILPSSLTSPTGIGYWLGDYFSNRITASIPTPQIEYTLPIVVNTPLDFIQPVPVAAQNIAIAEAELAPALELAPLTWQGILFASWLVGMTVLLALLIQRACFVKELIAQSTPAQGRLLETMDKLHSRMRIRRKIELRLSDTMLSPAVCGLFKPTILIPTALLEKFSREKLTAVLIHELAHVKRADIWVNMMQCLLQIVYFYNPLLWLANAMVRRTREQAVDEMVLVNLADKAQTYSNTLIDIAETAFWRPNLSLRLIGVAESKKALQRRIKHMLNRPIPKTATVSITGFLVIIIIGAILLPMGCNPAKQTTLETDDHIADNMIVPGLRVGQYTFDMTKAQVLESLGEPERIFYGGERYTLENLPRTYYMSFDDISFRILDDSVKEIAAISPFYRFTNGLRVGDSEEKIKQAFGENFKLKKTWKKDFLTYEDKGLAFEIDKNDRTIMEINVLPFESLISHKKPHIPSTSTVNEHGNIVDKIDYPFVNDPQVIGGWKSVDFVQEIDQFDPTKKSWQGDLYLNHLIFEKEGDIAGNILGWTKGLVLTDDTASKYIIKEMDGSTYMFFEWKSGDYTIRHMKPRYYVLRKVLTESLRYEPMFGEKAYIPPTSTINKKGYIIDKIDYPFIDDKRVIGTWKAIDFVSEIEQFKIGVQQWTGRGGNLFLNEMIFGKTGRLISKNDKVPRGYPGTWTKGLVIYDNDTQTASKYTLKDIDASTYMFYEWKSGDYTFRHSKPAYYILKKISSETGGLAQGWVSQPIDAEFARQLPAKIEQLDIDTADLEQVKEIFGKPAQYIWGKETFTEDNLPSRYILLYPAKFHIYMNDNKIVELRHESGFKYVFRDKLRRGSTLDEVFELIGHPEKIVEGEKNSFKDGVLYKDIEGRKGHCYYARSDQNVRLWFVDYKIIAIYMTRSNYGQHRQRRIATEKTPKKSQFTAKLPNGVTVELISVCKARDNQRCWVPDGSLFSKAPYYKSGVWASSEAFEFAFRVKNLDEKQSSTSWKIDGKYATGSGNRGNPEDEAGKKITDLWVIDAKIIKGVQNCDISFGVATPPWQIQAKCVGIQGTVTSKDQHPYTFSQAYIHKGMVCITVSDDMVKLAKRVIAIDKKGNIHLSESVGGSSTLNLRQSTFGFKNLPIENIQEFQFQTRAYEWVTFKNVSLKPGLKTNVQVSQSTDAELTKPLPAKIFIVKFKPIAPFAPQTARKLLNAFNESLPRGIRTHHYRTEISGNKLLGYICVDSKTGKDAVVSMIKKNKKLGFINTKLASEDDLQKLYKKKQRSLPNIRAKQKPTHFIDFEITKQGFLENDWIEITEILGTTGKIETGQTYTIKGKYKLSSRDQARLHLYATNGETRCKQGPIVKRGTGEFTRTFTYLEDGWLHLSFYPAYEQGGSFANLYFAQKGSNQQVPDMSHITSVVKAKAKPAPGTTSGPGMMPGVTHGPGMIKQEPGLNTEQIIAMLTKLETQRGRVQRSLNVSDDALDQVRSRWGFTDLERHSYPHPVTKRMTRLELEKDNCILEVMEFEALLSPLHTKPKAAESGELQDAKDKLNISKSKLKELEKMLAEAKARKRDLDMARVQYEKRKVTRDERRQRLSEIKLQIERTRMLHDRAEWEARKKKTKFAKVLKIVVYEAGKQEPAVTLNIPLTGLKISSKLLPQKIKKQLKSQGIDLNEILENAGRGVEPTTLLEVKDGGDRVTISLE